MFVRGRRLRETGLSSVEVKDDTSSSERLTPKEKHIRKLRKKLRQIEKLKLLDRELKEDELFKVNSKSDIRKELLSLLKDVEPEEYGIVKRHGVNSEDFGVISKKAKNIDAKAVDNLDVDSGLSSLNNSGQKPNEKNLMKESKSDCSPDDSVKEESSLLKKSGDSVKKDRVSQDDASVSSSENVFDLQESECLEVIDEWRPPSPVYFDL